MNKEPHKKVGFAPKILSSIIFAGAAAGMGGCVVHDTVPIIDKDEEAANDIVNQYETDREFKIITLSNGLQVFLTHDPDATSSAASMSIGVGYMDDPSDKQGLAHYAEHMLFLGTEEFPEAGYYKEFLSLNGGNSNAYTAPSETNYFFQLANHWALNDALNIFSDFFKKPMFDITYAEREVEAVNEEFNRTYRNDANRKMFVQNMMAEPGHPVNTLGVGNKETLGSGYNQETLREFFGQYYAASNMRLAVISGFPIEEQEKMVKEHFEEISDFKVEKKDVSPKYRKPLNNRYRLLEIEAVKDVRMMELSFPTIQLDEYDGIAPAMIVNSIINNKGNGSLASKLKDEGLAVDISSQSGTVHPEIHSTSIYVALTPEGMENLDRVMELIFSYIDMIKKKGVEKYIFDEKQTMSEISFRWQSPMNGSDYASAAASNMLKYDFSELEESPFLLSKYSPKAYKKYIKTINPENMMVTVLAQGLKTEHTSPHYNVEYSYKEVGGDSFKRISNPPKAEDEGLTYPEKNPYIPYNLSLKEQDEETKLNNDKPHLVINNDIAQIWAQFDTKFEQPKANISLKIETPLTYNKVENFISANLLETCVKEGMLEQAYPIAVGGLGYNVKTSNDAVFVELSGYTKNFNNIAKLVSENMTKCEADEEAFELMKENLIRNINNNKLSSASSQAQRISGQMFYDIYSDEEKLKAANDLTIEDIQQYAGKIFNRIYITGTAYGNLNNEDVRNVIEQFTSKLESTPLPEEAKKEIAYTGVKSGEDLVFSTNSEDNNNAILYMIKAGDKDTKERVGLQMINAVIGSDFYTELRSKRQLGYIVQSYPQQLEDDLFMNFLIQSRYGPVKLQDEIEDWTGDVMEIFDNLSEKEFEKIKFNIAENYKSESKNIAEESSKLFYLAAYEDADFDYMNKMSETANSLTIEDIKEMARNIFENSETPRIAVHIKSKDNNNPAPDGAYTNINEFKDRNKNSASPLPGNNM
jgi:insulysin